MGVTLADLRSQALTDPDGFWTRLDYATAELGSRAAAGDQDAAAALARFCRSTARYQLDPAGTYPLCSFSDAIDRRIGGQGSRDGGLGAGASCTCGGKCGGGAQGQDEAARLVRQLLPEVLAEMESTRRAALSYPGPRPALRHYFWGL
jgi:hypothetical protein